MLQVSGNLGLQLIQHHDVISTFDGLSRFQEIQEHHTFSIPIVNIILLIDSLNFIFDVNLNVVTLWIDNLIPYLITNDNAVQETITFNHTVVQQMHIQWSFCSYDNIDRFHLAQTLLSQCC